MSHTHLIDLPTKALLDKFGSGTHAPGSGSAAALMGILSGKLITTVAALTLKKPEYQADHRKIEHVATQIAQHIEPRLRELFEHDAKIFDEVIKTRLARDNATDDRKKRRYGERALEKLKDATDIPIEICEICLSLIDHGTAMFDIGFKGARGDTGAAISAAVAASMSAIFVINLNLRSFRGSDWAAQKRRKCDELHKSLEAKQVAAFGRLMTLRAEDVTSSMNFTFAD